MIKSGPSREPCIDTGEATPPYLADDYWTTTGFPKYDGGSSGGPGGGGSSGGSSSSPSIPTPTAPPGGKPLPPPPPPPGGSGNPCPPGEKSGFFRENPVKPYDCNMIEQCGPEKNYFETYNECENSPCPPGEKSGFFRLNTSEPYMCNEEEVCGPESDVYNTLCKPSPI